MFLTNVHFAAPKLSQRTFPSFSTQLALWAKVWGRGERDSNSFPLRLVLPINAVGTLTIVLGIPVSLASHTLPRVVCTPVGAGSAGLWVGILG